MRADALNTLLSEDCQKEAFQEKCSRCTDRLNLFYSSVVLSNPWSDVKVGKDFKFNLVRKIWLQQKKKQQTLKKQQKKNTDPDHSCAGKVCVFLPLLYDWLLGCWAELHREPVNHVERKGKVCATVLKSFKGKSRLNV